MSRVKYILHSTFYILHLSEALILHLSEALILHLSEALIFHSKNINGLCPNEKEKNNETTNTEG